MRKLAAVVAVLVMGAAFAEQPDKWVSYVEATGNQWVDTGIIGRWNTKAECKVEWMAFTDSAFLAARDGAYQHPTKPNGKMYFCYCLNADGVMYTAQDASEAVNWYRQSVTWWPRFEKNRVYNYTAEYTATNGEGKATNIIKVDGQQTDNITKNGFDSGLNLYIFANNQTNKATACSKARCYGLKIWQGPKDGGDMVLVRDFQPCVKDNRAGLYDSVSDTIFYSKSGTDLICDENSEVPDEFIEYVESQGDVAYKDGLPAYVDTGIIGRSGTKICGEWRLNSRGGGWRQPQPQPSAHFSVHAETATLGSSACSTRTPQSHTDTASTAMSAEAIRPYMIALGKTATESGIQKARTTMCALPFHRVRRQLISSMTICQRQTGS